MKLQQIGQADNICFTNKNMGRMILDRSYKMDAHAHNRIEIMLLVSGSLDVLFGFEATPPPITGRDIRAV